MQLACSSATCRIVFASCGIVYCTPVHILCDVLWWAWQIWKDAPDDSGARDQNHPDRENDQQEISRRALVADIPFFQLAFVGHDDVIVKTVGIVGGVHHIFFAAKHD